jgi:hypothetical protein
MDLSIQNIPTHHSQSLVYEREQFSALLDQLLDTRSALSCGPSSFLTLTVPQEIPFLTGTSQQEQPNFSHQPAQIPILHEENLLAHTLQMNSASFLPMERCGHCLVVRPEGATVRDGPDIDNSTVLGR